MLYCNKYIKLSKFIFLLLILSSISLSCVSPVRKNLTQNQMIKATDCKQITIIKSYNENSRKGTYCITTMKRLNDLYLNTYLAYVGSNDTYYFFYWYVKKKYYQDQPTGFAVLKNEYTPKSIFNVELMKIGENPFIKD